MDRGGIGGRGLYRPWMVKNGSRTFAFGLASVYTRIGQCLEGESMVSFYIIVGKLSWSVTPLEIVNMVYEDKSQ